ncbi:MAG: hypothetical protein PHQ81_07245 [Methanofollis sp.]|nr:hypothetical protein [Methanofollis sp.]
MNEFEKILTSRTHDGKIWKGDKIMLLPRIGEDFYRTADQKIERN